MEQTLSENYGTATSIVLDNTTQTGYIEMGFHSLSELKGLLEQLDKNITTDTLLRGNLTMQVNNKNEANALLLQLALPRPSAREYTAYKGVWSIRN